MVVDYSKWDKLELSDDSDIEVHPNVDKKSFIRWKQQDIHERRDQRRQEIEHLQVENRMSSYLLTRLAKLVESLEQISPSLEESEVASVVNQAIATASADDPDEEKPQSGPGYGDMIRSLIDQVSSEVSSAPRGSSRVQALSDAFKKHQEKLTNLQSECVKRLTELQNEEASRIRSDDLKIGFDSTMVSKKKVPEAAASSATKASTKPVSTKKPQKIEVLNRPNSSSSTGSSAGSSITRYDKGKAPLVDDEGDADDEADDTDAEDDFTISPLAEKFASIPVGNYRQCIDFIARNPEIVSEAESDGILMDAFSKEMKGQPNTAKQYVHNALLLQYCARLGRDGVTVFFGKIMTPNHKSLPAFLQDVDQTYKHVKTRSEILLEEQKSKLNEVEEEQIINLDTVTDEELAELGITREDIEKFKIEQAEQDALEQESANTQQ
ncbi:Cdc37 N terminal kinase binding-domain-containing protein [Lipomyces oligophaga]|uniref:Cdc37 N terminal kinase binding-domain-containing protein n=1 Tax=Lipomyces oligophaga TaxID=45792 RepID=UPI0034CF78F1